MNGEVSTRDKPCARLMNEKEMNDMWLERYENEEKQKMCMCVFVCLCVFVCVFVCLLYICLLCICLFVCLCLLFVVNLFVCLCLL